eukprot:scaffold686_cov177-Ochromonas_danica.AAC.20
MENLLCKHMNSLQELEVSDRVSHSIKTLSFKTEEGIDVEGSVTAIDALLDSEEVFLSTTREIKFDLTGDQARTAEMPTLV